MDNLNLEKEVRDIMRRWDQAKGCTPVTTWTFIPSDMESHLRF